MRAIRKRVVTDESMRPVAVQIDYEDWLEIERALGLESSVPRIADLAHFRGVLTLDKDPLAYQRQLREEWP